MTDRFHSFVILAGMRTGSNLLEANLNALEGITSYGEVFNPGFIGKKNADELFGITLAHRDRNPKALLEKLRSETEGLSGFRLFHDHDQRILATVLADPRCAKIILTRNPFESYVSLLIARETGQWRLSDAKRLKTATAHFDQAEFVEHLERTQAFQLRVLHALQTTGQTGFVLDYEDLGRAEVLNGLAAYLGIPARLARLDDTLKKQNPEPLAEKLDNPEALHAAAARLDLFGLARTPIFEPRRPAHLHHAVASDGARLLFFPVTGSADLGVRQWLERFGPLTKDFSAPTLSQWKNQNPGHRSFTVVRHPLLRAYLAFHSRIVSGVLANHRLVLIRAYKAQLPDPGAPFPDLEAERRAFLVFLHYARLSVLGQGGQRVDPGWASQTAILQGISTYHPLDLVIREDALANGLGFLTGKGDIGPIIEPGLDEMVGRLARIYDDQLEAAAATAYARDYTGFGFTRWRDHAA